MARGTIVIGARGSALSLCQTRIVQVRLEERFPDHRVEVKTIRSSADERPEASLATIGGEGVFVTELETALLNGTIDLAVHSLKDLPLKTPPGLALAAVTEREDPRDVLVSRSGSSFEQLPAGSRLGTSSLRRSSQLRLRRRDVECVEIRGNVDTRLRKLQEGRYDAVVLAAAGLLRLGLEDRITEYLGLDLMLPEPGQGALGLETRADDRAARALAEALHDRESAACVTAERAFLRALGGGCRVPIAALGQLDRGRLTLDGAVMAADGSKQLRDRAEGSIDNPDALGESLAQRLIARGASDLLAGRNI